MNAERGGFEPPVPFLRHSISSAAQSAALSPLRDVSVSQPDSQLLGQRIRLAELAQLSAWLAELTGGGRFSGGRGFALGHLDVVCFDSGHRVQSVAELAANGIEVAPLGVAGPCFGGDFVFVEFFFKGRQLRARAVELPFQIVSFHSHVDFVCLKLVRRVRDPAEKRGGIVASGPVSINSRRRSMHLKNRFNFNGDVARK